MCIFDRYLYKLIPLRSTHHSLARMTIQLICSTVLMGGIFHIIRIQQSLFRMRPNLEFELVRVVGWLVGREVGLVAKGLDLFKTSSCSKRSTTITPTCASTSVARFIAPSLYTLTIIIRIITQLQLLIKIIQLKVNLRNSYQ